MKIQKFTPRILLVGVGQICQQAHIPVIQNTDASVVQVIEPNLTMKSKIANLFPRAKWSTSMNNIVQDVNCAIISSPTALHAEHTFQLLKRGLHVLCEKPLATSKDDGKNLIEEAKKNKVILQVGYYRRFHPASSAIKDIIKNSSLGICQRILILGGHIDDRSGPPSLMDVKLSGGGCTMDIGSHIIDRLFSWFNDLHLDYYADDDHGSRIESNALIRLSTTNKKFFVPITILLSRSTPLGYKLICQFEKGLIECELNLGHQLLIYHKSLIVLDEERSFVSTLNLSREHDYLFYFKKQWDEFINQINGTHSTYSSLIDALNTTDILEKCYRNRQQLDIPWDINPTKL